MPEPDDQLHRRAARQTLDPTRAKPPPWFIGGSQSVMLAVLGLCAVLFVARTVTMWWMVEAAWAWWHAPFSMQRDAPPSVRPPPVDRRLAQARLSGNPAAAFSADNYPPDAIRADEQGRTVADLSINAAGVPTRCVVKTSSGSRSLDRATCEIALAKVRFSPARDERGAPIPSHYTLPVRWVLPQ